MLVAEVDAATDDGLDQEASTASIEEPVFVLPSAGEDSSSPTKDDPEDVYELLGCVGCGESFQDTSALQDHQDQCPGLASGCEGDEAPVCKNFYLACARCPDINFKTRCELIVHLRNHKRLKKKKCVCLRRPCVCVKRLGTWKARKSESRECSSKHTECGVCDECFAQRLRIGSTRKTVGESVEKKTEPKPSPTKMQTNASGSSSTPY